MTSSEIRSRFLEFFKKRGHAVIPSASLVTLDEKGVTNSTLFNTAGMQPLVPYLLGTPHPEGTRLVDVQKCLRTVDIDDIGDKTHATFFEMLGNWSLGDYFKKDAINWSYEFLTSKEEGLGLDPKRLYITVFEGDSNAPKDEEAVSIWKEVFSKNGIETGGDTSKGEVGRVFYMPAKNNWWEAGDNGPCGPDTEMFYDVANRFGGKTISHTDYVDGDDKRDLIEVWNDVFMQYEKKDGKVIGKLPKPSVDTGAGLERLTMTMQGVDNIYDTDLLKPVMDLMAKAQNDVRNKRIIADHLRASIFLIADGVKPSNTDRGYILRRLIRRAIMNTTDKKLDEKRIAAFVGTLIKVYEGSYPELGVKSDLIIQTLNEECAKFSETLVNGLKELHKLMFGKVPKPIMLSLVSNTPLKPEDLTGRETMEITGKDIFKIVTTYGFPFEVCMDELSRVYKELYAPDETNYDIRKTPLGEKLKREFNEEMKQHQDLSRAGAEQKFKGGLADTNDPMVIRYHTATHLLHQALHDVLGEETGNQKGSNITAERLRFDFTGIKLTDEQKKKIEDIVNEKISAALPMNQVTLPKAEAEKTGARHFFGEKYGEEISIYFIGKDLNSAYSKEFCGGPHVKNTSELAGPEGKWKFKIQKEEAVAQGIRRIKAVLQ